MSPYLGLYGRPRPTISSYIPKTAWLQSVEDELVDRDVTLQLLKDNLVKAQEKIKKFADKNRSEGEFQVGDLVFLRLQPCRQISVRSRRPQKLSPLFFGPYTVLQRVGQVAYKLDLLSEARIHPIFHVSHLKRKLGATGQVQHQILTDSIEQIHTPEAILER